MAQIKIAGLKENLIVSNDKAKSVNEVWLNDSIPNSKKIIIENISTIKGDIRGIFLEKEEKRQELPPIENFGKPRTILSKEQRAEMTNYFRSQNWYKERKVVWDDIYDWCRLKGIKYILIN